MTDLQLTDHEAGLLLELLETERRELGPEIHHTDTAKLRDTLQTRLRAVDRLAERLEAATAGARK